MSILVCFTKNHKVRSYMAGRTLDSLMIAVVMYKNATKKISKEYGMPLDEAKMFVLDCIKEGFDTLGTEEDL